MVRSFTILLLLGLLVPCMVALDPMIEQALEEAKDPTPLVFVEEGDSTSLIELGVKGQKCANGYYCPMENGVCCKTGNVCCDSACANDDNGSPTCDLTVIIFYGFFVCMFDPSSWLLEETIDWKEGGVN